MSLKIFFQKIFCFNNIKYFIFLLILFSKAFCILLYKRQSLFLKKKERKLILLIIYEILAFYKKLHILTL
jgi:hypothetical protein